MPQRVEGPIDIQRPVSEVYSYWETLENLPQFMSNVEEVLATGPDTTHWRVKGPFGASLEFDARTTEKEPNSAIAWNTVGGEVGTTGEVRFSEVGPRRTRVEVVMNYSDPPGGKVGEKVSRLVADPQFMLAQDLENLKAVLEGEATPEDIRRRPSASEVQSAVVGGLVLVAGISILAAVGVAVVLKGLAEKREASP